MEKKASPNKTESGGEIASLSKVSGLSEKALRVIQFVLGFCLLPLVYSTSVAFLKEFSVIEKSLQQFFWSGVIAFLLIFLFVWELAVIHAWGQRLMEGALGFFKPLAKAAAYLLPVYALILFFAYWALTFFKQSPRLTEYFMFFFGFTMALHIVLSAYSLRTQSSDFLKGNYILGFSCIFIVNAILLSLLLSLIFIQFSFADFFNHSLAAAENIFYALFKQLFLMK